MNKVLPTGITLRKDGRYQWRFKYNGQTYMGYAVKLADAKSTLNEKRYQVQNGLYSKEKNILFGAWFEEWLVTFKEPAVKPSTLNTYRNTYARYIEPEFGGRKIKNLRAEQIQHFTNRKAAEYSKTVASTINFLLYDCLQQAARMGIICKNPMDNTTPPKFRKREKKKALTPEQEKLFLDTVKYSRYYPIYRMATLTGMRIGEILGLSWDDVDFAKGEIHVTHTLSYISGKAPYLDTPKSEASRRIWCCCCLWLASCWNPTPPTVRGAG